MQLVGAIERLSFGRDDAESDLAEGGLLRAGFLRTKAYHAALNGDKQLVIGRKGSGKSAICVTLAEANGDTAAAPAVTCLVTPDDMSIRAMHRFQLQGLDPLTAKELIWRYVIGVQVAKYVVDHANRAHDGPVPESVDRLRQFLLANQELDDPRLHEKLLQVTKRLSGSLSLDAFGVKVEAGVGSQADGPRAVNGLDIVERNVKSAIADLGCSTKERQVRPKRPWYKRRQTVTVPPCDRMLILVDQIEKIWTNDPDSDAIVIGLLRASKHVGSRFPGVSCVVFLRTDIYDQLRYGELDKFRSAEMRLDWKSSDLQDLVRARAAASIGCDLSTAELWGDLFPARIGTTPTGEYMVRHTLRRPRDVIQFANACRDRAYQRDHDRITESDVRSALGQYSAWKLQDLAGEYLVGYPFLDRLFPLFEDSGYMVLRKELETRFSDAYRDRLVSDFPEFREQLTLDTVIDVLYGIGFLGTRRQQRVTYVFDDPRRIEPTELEFYVHPCFREALRAVTARAVHPYRSGVAMSRVLRGTPGGRIGGELALRRPDLAALLGSTVEAARAILEYRRGAGLPELVCLEIDRFANRVMSDTERLLEQWSDHATGPMYADRGLIQEYVRNTAEHLGRFAQDLTAGGLGDDPEIQAFAEVLDDRGQNLMAQLRNTRGFKG